MSWVLVLIGAFLCLSLPGNLRMRTRTVLTLVAVSLTLSVVYVLFPPR